jgi:hypothetical protein
MRAPNRLQLSVVATVAAMASATLIALDRQVGAAVAAVIAVGCIAEAWRRQP